MNGMSVNGLGMGLSMGLSVTHACIDNQTSTSWGGTFQGSSIGCFSSFWLLFDEERAQIRLCFILVFHFNLNLCPLCVRPSLTVPELGSRTLCCTELVEFLY